MGQASSSAKVRSIISFKLPHNLTILIFQAKKTEASHSQTTWHQAHGEYAGKLRSEPRQWDTTACATLFILEDSKYILTIADQLVI